MAPDRSAQRAWEPATGELVSASFRDGRPVRTWPGPIQADPLSAISSVHAYPHNDIQEDDHAQLHLTAPSAPAGEDAY